jgi:exonuclease VII small subunit
MNRMSIEPGTSWNNPLLSLLSAIWNHPIVRFIRWAKWIITLGTTIALLSWQAYILGQNISKDLTSDYAVVTSAQTSLIKDSLEFRDALLNPNVAVDLDLELTRLRERAVTTLAALGGLRAPTDDITVAQREYRDALQQLIAVSNRLARGEIEDMAQPLHNALQSVANEGGDLNEAVKEFQGGMWPQLKGAIF